MSEPTQEKPSKSEHRETMRKWNKPLIRFFRTQNIPSPDHYDLAQDTILEFLKKSPEYLATKMKKGPRAYLWGIARNKIKQYWAARARRPTEMFNSAGHSPTFGTTPSIRLNRKQGLLLLLQQLSGDVRLAFQLKWEGLTYDEIADVMKISPATVKRKLQDARKRLVAQGSKLIGPDSREEPIQAVERAYRSS